MTEEEVEDENPDVLRDAILEALDSEGADFVAECFQYGSKGLNDLDPIANKARGDILGATCWNCKKEYPDDSDFVPIRMLMSAQYLIEVPSPEPKIMYVCGKCALDLPNAIPEEQLRLDEPCFDGNEFG